MSIDRFLDSIEPAWNWWTSLFAEVPEYPFAVAFYVGGSALVLLLWTRVARALPRPLGGMSWVLLMTLLLTPTITGGEDPGIAPAVVGLGLALASKQYDEAMTYLLPMLGVMGMGFLVGFLLERIYAPQPGTDNTSP